MKLYIRQKIFSWTDKFYIVNEFGENKYYVQGELLSWGKKLHVYDMADCEVAFIQQKVFSFLPKFFVFKNNTQVAEIKKEFTLFKPKYFISGPNWDIDGSFFMHDYQIMERGAAIAHIHKQWMTWGDCYELNIVNDACDETLVLAAVLIIDCVIDQSDD